MAEATLSQASARFAATARETLKDSARSSVLAEVSRFVRWYGAERPLSGLRGYEVSLYADVLGPATSEASRRADHVRLFLAFLKKEGLTATNMAPHLRLRKGNKTGMGAGPREQAIVEFTQGGLEALQAELESLKEQRLGVREEIRRAMLDKDFRENAPLDAAKEKQGHLEARIREIEAMLKRAVVVDAAAPSGRVQVGSAVVLKNLNSGTMTSLTIVGPTEASAVDGKISSVSPVGRALLHRAVGDEVEVSAPAGVLRFRVEEIRG